MSWIKIETHTFDKIEIYSIAQSLGIDPDSAFGKCCRVWSWFDANTTDGITPSVTEALLDRYCGVTGFCKAMISAGWMRNDGETLELPYYERHNSKSAKARALGAKRQEKFKSNAHGNDLGNASADDISLPKSLHREEKRREEKKEINTKEHSNASRLPADWLPSEDDISFCQTERPDLICSQVKDRFKDYWIAQPGAKGRKTDWPATWRNWVRNERQQISKTGPPRQETIHQEKTRNLVETLTSVGRQNGTFTIDQ